MVSLAEVEAVAERQPYIFEEGRGEKTGFSPVYSKNLKPGMWKTWVEQYEKFFTIDECGKVSLNTGAVTPKDMYFTNEVEYNDFQLMYEYFGYVFVEYYVPHVYIVGNDGTMDEKYVEAFKERYMIDEGDTCATKIEYIVYGILDNFRYQKIWFEEKNETRTAMERKQITNLLLSIEDQSEAIQIIVSMFILFKGDFEDDVGYVSVILADNRYGIAEYMKSEP
jgi:hypothetical protein